MLPCTYQTHVTLCGDVKSLSLMNIISIAHRPLHFLPDLLESSGVFRSLWLMVVPNQRDLRSSLLCPFQVGLEFLFMFCLAISVEATTRRAALRVCVLIMSCPTMFFDLCSRTSRFSSFCCRRSIFDQS